MNSVFSFMFLLRLSVVFTGGDWTHEILMCSDVLLFKRIMLLMSYRNIIGEMYILPTCFD